MTEKLEETTTKPCRKRENDNNEQTCLGVMIGAIVSKSVAGNSTPLALSSSYISTTPTSAGFPRKASAQDWNKLSIDYRNFIISCASVD
jgi:hypothetical protein